MALTPEQRKRLDSLLKRQSEQGPPDHNSGIEKATPGSLSPKIRTEAAHTTNPIKGTDYV